jgi:4-hydroxybenzoate polyprenyltransferase
LLLFAPLIAAHLTTDAVALAQATGAFAVFCLVSSALYVLNDLLDLESDRVHPSKRTRPFASGDVSLWYGFFSLPILLLVAAAVALVWLPRDFQAWTLLYVLGAALYSFWLKRLAILDVLALAGMYTLRIIAGAAALGVPLSSWLLLFSMFLFLSLALVKRHADICMSLHPDQKTVPGRGYSGEDALAIGIFGVIGGYISVLVYALYISSHDVALLYQRPEWLWLFCPALLYWITRVWLLSFRGNMPDDPIRFAVSDLPTYLVAASLFGCMYLAS